VSLNKRVCSLWSRNQKFESNQSRMLAGRRCLLTYTLATETAPLVRDRGEAVLLLRAKLLFVAATERPLVFEVEGASRGHERDTRNSSPSAPPPALGLFL
jgi:hypothetical protein